jgi:RimJ/RimL family protein N-acetyltransferase
VTVNHPPYRIDTERLVIRCWNPEDAPLLKAAVDHNIEHLKPFMPWAWYEPTDLETKVNLLRTFRGKFDLDQDFTYGIFSRDERQVLGGCGLHTRQGKFALEMGYWIDHDHCREGLATEAAEALTEAAWTVDGIDRVEIRHQPDNLASARVPEKLGYTREAVLRRTNTLFPGEFRDSVVWVTFRTPPGGPA